MKFITLCSLTLLLATQLHVTANSQDIYSGSAWEDPYIGYPTQSFDLAVASDGTITAACWGVGFYKSVDSGDSWTFAGFPFGLYPFRVEAGADPGYMFAASNTGVVMRSTDNGGSWSSIILETGLPGLTEIVSPTPSTVFVRADDLQTYRSTDNGDTWGLTQYFPSVRTSSGRLYATVYPNLYASDDNGVTWYIQGTTPQPLYNSNRPQLGLGINEEIFFSYVESSGGEAVKLWKSTDEGLTWALVRSLDYLGTYYSLKVFEDNIFLGGGAYVYRSPDNGITWVTYGPLAGASIETIAANHEGDIFLARSAPGHILRLSPSISTGSIEGSVLSGGQGMHQVVVKLLDTDGLPVIDFDPIETNSDGHFSFLNVPAGSYQVMIVEPVGYYAEANPKTTNLASGEANQVDFVLTELVLVNTCRSKGYWKHQFDVYLTGKGDAQESQASLYSYIDLVQANYTPHFDIFADATQFADWQGVLSVKGNAGMFEKARQQLAAFVLNLVSLKVGQYMVVTEDGRTAGDALTFVSELIGDGDDSNDELAKDLAELVNNQETIAAGTVPDRSTLYRTGGGEQPVGAPEIFALYSNYPNPFNPATTITYDLPVKTHVTLIVSDIMGREVATLVDGSEEVGYKSVTFDANNLASGIYFYRLQAGSFVETRKLILMK